MKRHAACLAFLVVLQTLAVSAPLTLDESVTNALKSNESVISAERKVQAASAAVTQAVSGFLPAVSLNASYAKNYQAPMETSFNGIPVRFGIDEAGEIKGWDATITQNITTFGKLEGAVSASKNAYSSAVLDLKKTRQEAVYQTVTAFFGVIKAKRYLKLSEANLLMARSHLEQARAMMAAGLATRADILRSEVAVTGASEALIKASNGLRLAESAFNNAIGRPLSLTVEISENDFDSQTVIENFDLAKLLGDAKRYRPELAQLDISVKLADDKMTMAKGEWLPSVAVQGKYGWNNTNYPVNLINYDSTSWTIAAGASWKIFDGFGSQAKIKEAEMERSAAEYSRRMAVRAIELEIQQALLNYNSSRDVIEACLAGLASAKENYDVALVRYRNGLGTNIEVLDALTALTKAEVDLLTAKYDLRIARAQIEKAVGVIDMPQKEAVMSQLRVTGVAKYFDLEGGFIGVISDDGRKFLVAGPKAVEISKKVGRDMQGISISITGTVKNNVSTIQMWGTPFEVIEYDCGKGK